MLYFQAWNSLRKPFRRWSMSWKKFPLVIISFLLYVTKEHFWSCAIFIFIFFNMKQDQSYCKCFVQLQNMIWEMKCQFVVMSTVIAYYYWTCSQEKDLLITFSKATWYYYPLGKRRYGNKDKWYLHSKSNRKSQNSRVLDFDIWNWSFLFYGISKRKDEH